MTRYMLRAALLAVFGMATTVTDAAAGTMIAYSCHTPMGRFAGTLGWQPGYLGGTFGGGDGCASGSAGTLHAQTRSRAEVQAWRFVAAPDTFIVSFSAALCGETTRSGAVSIAADDVPLVPVQVWGAPSLGCQHPPWYRPRPVDDYVSRDGLSASRLSVRASCSQVCAARIGTARIDVSEFRASIRDDAVPTVTAVRGPLVASTSHFDSETLSFDAIDRGVGLYRAIADVRVEGSSTWQEVATALVGWQDTCFPLRETNYLYEFTSPQPCPLVATASELTVDNQHLPPGEHEIRVRIEDAAGNRADILTPRPYHVPEPYRPSVSPDVDPTPGPMSDESPGPPVTIATPPRAHLRITVPGDRRVLSPGSSRLAGRLLDANSKPLAGATVVVQTRPYLPKLRSAIGPWTVLGEIVTDGRGVFRTSVPPGGSRMLLVSYRTAPTDPEPATTALAEMLVAAQIAVRAQSTRVRNGQSLVLRGRVSGPIPDGGVLVALEVRDASRWSPVATTRRWVRTTESGAFALSYRFTRTFRAARYRFRVVADEDSAFQYARGASRSIEVHVRP